MNFVRWVFYDTSGAVKYTGMQRGDFAHVPSEQVAAALGLTGCACLEWTEPNADIEAAFEPVDADGNPRIVHVSVDVSGEAPQLVFTYEAVPEQTQDNPYDIIDTLTGEV